MNLTDRAYMYVHDKLTGGQIAPGTRLTNRAVAKEMGISLTPIHCAFNRLISEGLLDYRPGIGVFVPFLDRRDIEDMYEFRETLECAAVAKVCGGLSDQVLEQLRGCNKEIAVLIAQLEQTAGSPMERDTLDRLRMLDTEFHMILLRAAGNRRALQAVEDIGVRMCMQVYDTKLMNFSLANLTRTIHEHERILVALCVGDTQQAQQLMSQHIRRGCQRVVEGYDHHYMEKGKHHLHVRSAAQRDRASLLRAAEALATEERE